MRIERLDLTRYGRFTDASVDFPAPPPGGADMHIVFGPNEAGKSTLFSAWLDLLFGIPLRTRYSFLHPGATMQVGARVAHGGEALEVVRRKGNGPTLFDRTGNALAETTMQALLGGLSREGYSAMFSLDDETLEEGGESILSSGGELGQLLFSASAGLSSLTAQLDALHEKLDGFHRKGKRSGTLYEAKRRLEALTKSARGLETSAAEQKRRQKTVEAAKGEWQNARTHEAETRRHLEAVSAARAAQPLVQRLSRLRERLAGLGDLPNAGVAETEEYAALEQARIAVAARQETLERRHAEIVADLAGLTPDPAVLAQAPQILEAEALRAEHDSAVKDLPRRRQELAEVSAAIGTTLSDLGQRGGDAAALIVPPFALAQMRALLTRRSGVIQAAETASAEARKAQQAAEAEAERLGDPGPMAEGEAITALTTLLSRIDAADPEQKYRQAARDHDTAQTKLRDALAALEPWQGDGEALAALAPPTGWRMEAWRADLETTRRAAEDARRELAHHEELLAALRAQIEAQDDEPAGLDLAAAAGVRALREELWSAHRALMTSDSARAFETAMRQDDQHTARMGMAIARGERMAAEQAQLRAAVLATATARVHAQTTQVARQTLLDEIGAACDALGLPQASFDELERWLSRRIDALTFYRATTEAATALSRAGDELFRAAGSLARLMGKPAPQEGQAFAPLWAEATALCRSAEQRQDTRKLLKRMRSEGIEREDIRRQAVAELSGWRIEWMALCEGTPLADLPWDSDQTGTMLDHLDRLAVSQREHDSLLHRVTTMEANRARFREARDRITADLDMPAETPWATVLERRDQALKIEDARKRLLVDKEKQEKALQDDRRAAQDNDAALRRLGERLNWTTGADRPLGAHVAACVEAAGLRDEIAQLGADLAARPVSADLAGLDEEGLRTLEQDLAMAVEAAQHDNERLLGLVSDAQHALDQIGSDDALAKISAEQENIRLTLAEDARTHLSRRFGLIALEIALRRYRDSHQSAMLAHASHAFARLTRGGYPSLSVLPQGNSDRLVAVGAGGATRMAADMSKGTRFQLYLALRIAGYHELARTRPAVPFIADDIMETFDDERARAAFSLLGEMSQTGQVIYLTHHRHLCDLASAACPSARVIDLQSL